MEQFNFLNLDCLDYLKNLKKNTIQLIITSHHTI